MWDLHHEKRSISKRQLSTLCLLAGGVAISLFVGGRLVNLGVLVNEAARSLGTLVLAVGVVLVANYLSGGRRPHHDDRMGVRCDQDIPLELEHGVVADRRGRQTAKT